MSSAVWRCSCCGEMKDPADPRWRWNGEAWEHKCGDPQAGYFPARYFGPRLQMVDGFPRRNRIDLLTPAEKAIYDAVQAVENLPADVRLTDAVILLQAARDKVADYIESISDSAVPEHTEVRN